MTKLLSQAQAVLDVAYREMDYAPRRHVQWVVVAALRAAADQVVPEQELDDVPGRFVNGCCHEQRQKTRAELLAIAAELEGSSG
jgi:hypothetical protein